MKASGNYPGISVEDSLKKGKDHTDKLEKEHQYISASVKQYQTKEDFQTPENLKNQHGSSQKRKPDSPPKDQKVAQIARDDANTEVFSWGCDRHGQLGLGITYDKEEGAENTNQPQPRFCVYGVTI